MEFNFKLMGSLASNAEAEIDLTTDLTVAQVKEIVRKTFKIAPFLTIDLMFKGKKLVDTGKWGKESIRPDKDTILVIGSRND